MYLHGHRRDSFSTNLESRFAKSQEYFISTSGMYSKTFVLYFIVCISHIVYRPCIFHRSLVFNDKNILLLHGFPTDRDYTKKFRTGGRRKKKSHRRGGRSRYGPNKLSDIRKINSYYGNIR